MLHGIQMSSSGMQSNDQVPETPQFCTQGGLETINLGEEVGSTVVKTPKTRFQPKEDEVLIQSWLNSSKNAIIGIDQIGESFWKRIGEAYNKYRDKKYIERKPMALKGRWHKINHVVQKFVGCYKQAVTTQKSGSCESNIISAAKQIYYQDEHEKFIFEDAWRLLKNEDKWLGGETEPSTKRTKNSASGAYSSSSNPQTPTSSEYNPPSPTSLRRPMGQKAAKRKEKEKLVEKSMPLEKIDDLQDDLKKKVGIMLEFSRNWTRLEEERLEMERERLKINDLQILSNDTSNMNQRQLQAHEMLCDIISKKYGLN
ncbi:unnamed protein product [Trifolium pratense]|uniref:Uncharacterized protein n=1 Tax=Trifolium pratense TaxID=57577 RepID=A0ACB0K3T3_TRIPR|nr:unnamed protein product [Trifolium pratense]